MSPEREDKAARFFHTFALALVLVTFPYEEILSAPIGVVVGGLSTLEKYGLAAIAYLLLQAVRQILAALSGAVSRFRQRRYKPEAKRQ